jgi:acyl-coenzyme A synthetase/AMP-(fatty) acid ligase
LSASDIALSHVWFVDALPKGPTGKIQKRDIVIPPDLTAS